MDHEAKVLRAENPQKQAEIEHSPNNEIRPVEYPGLPIPDPKPEPDPSPSGTKPSNIKCPYCNGTNVKCARIVKVGEPALFVCFDCKKDFKQ